MNTSRSFEESLTMDNASAAPSIAASVASKSSNNTNNKQQSQSKEKKKVANNNNFNIEDYTNSIVQGKLAVKHAFGCNATAVDGIQSYATAASGEKDCAERLIIKVGCNVAFLDLDTQDQKFLSGQGKNVRHIYHVAISPNNKHVSVCESTRYEPDSPGDAQLSLYALGSFTKHKTLTYQSTADFIYSEYSTDNKYLYALMNHPTDNNVVIWLVHQEKIFKVVSIPTSVKKIRVCTLPTLQMFTATGPGHLKLWYFGIDATFKYTNLLPSSKGSEGNVLDQAWLKSHTVIHKVVCLVDLETTNSNGHASGSIAGVSDHSSHVRKVASESLKESKKQCIYVFEGQEAGQTAIPPISLELRQTIFLKPIVSGSITSYATALSTYSKGFLLLGSTAIVSIYDRTEEKRDPYIEVKRVSLGEFSLIAACTLLSEDRFAVVGSNGRILSVAMDASTSIAKKIDNADSDGNNAGGAAANQISQMNQEIDVIVKDYEQNIMWKTDRDVKDPESKLLQSTGAIDIISGGFHCEPIIAVDIAYDRAIVVAISSNRYCRFWNYETLKCELVHNFKDEEPLCCALNNSGYQLLVGFIDRVILYNILNDKLSMFKETIVKNCREIKYSHGNHYWAGASGMNVVVYETKSFNQLQMFQGHMMNIKKLIWAPGDQVLFSAGTEGNLFGWCVADPSQRLEVISSNNRTAMIVAVEVDSNCTAFPSSKKDIDESDINYMPPTRTCIVSTQDSNVKVIPWTYEIKVKSALSLVPSNNISQQKKQSETVLMAGDRQTIITCLCLSYDKKHLFTGTSAGKLRIYPWPPPKQTSSIYSLGGGEKSYDFGELFFEISVHAGPVVDIKMSPMQDAVVSAGADGSVFITSFTSKIGGDVTHTTEGSIESSLADEKDYTEFQFNRDLIRVGTDDLQEHYHEVAALQSLLENIKSKATSVFNYKQAQFRNELTKIYDHQETKVADEIKKYEKLQADFQSHSEYLKKTMSSKDVAYIEMTSELEHRFKRKLEDQMVRFDNLTEEMEGMKQKFESLMIDEKTQFVKQLQDLKHVAKGKEKMLKRENKIIISDKLDDESSFKVILEEQEGEYEDELRQLIGAAESEMSKERDNIQKLKLLVTTKNERLDQLKKKLLELNNIVKARQILLQNEIAQKKQLHATIDHYEKNLKEREKAIAEKDKTIIELTSTTRTLENFRFVLDHRLQQLSSERGPITQHIEGLERHIATMYEELVEEFDLKKSVAENLQNKETKVRLQEKDLAKMAREMRNHEEYISSFKRDMDNIFQANLEGKWLEEAVNSMYRKYIRNEPIENVVKANDIVKNIVEELIHNPHHKKGDLNQPIVEEDEEVTVREFKFGDDAAILDKISSEVVDTCKESDRQRLFKEKEVMNLKGSISKKNLDGQNMGRRSMYDNSNLLYDSATMQKTIRKMAQDLADVREEHLIVARDLKNLTKLAAELKANHENKVALGLALPAGTSGQRPQLQQQAGGSTTGSSKMGGHIDGEMKRVSMLDQPNSEFGIVSKPSLSKFKIDMDLRSVDLTAGTDKISGGGFNGNADGATINHSAHGSTIVGNMKSFNPKSNSLSNFSLATDRDFSVDETPQNKSKSMAGAATHTTSENNKIISVKMNRGNSASAIVGRPGSGGAPPASKPGSARGGLQQSASAAAFPNLLQQSMQQPALERKRPQGAAPLPNEKIKHQEKTITSLEAKIFSIESTLDTLTREKDMQRLEITRIRKEIARKSMEMGKLSEQNIQNTQLSPMGSLSYSVSTLNGGDVVFPSDDNFEVHSESSSKNLIGLGGSKSLSVKANRSLTSADTTGKPSQEDLKKLSLGPR